MRQQRIENPTIDQVQPGDWVEGTYEDHKFAGEAWEIAGVLRVGGTDVRWWMGSEAYKHHEVEITALTRDVPDLPTKPGTVGRATVRGVPNVRIVLHKNGAWFSPSLDVDDYRGHYEHHIDASTFVLELEGDGE